jgi:hypothetical protein
LGEKKALASCNLCNSKEVIWFANEMSYNFMSLAHVKEAATKLTILPFTSLKFFFLYMCGSLQELTWWQNKCAKNKMIAHIVHKATWKEMWGWQYKKSLGNFGRANETWQCTPPAPTQTPWRSSMVPFSGHIQLRKC